MLYIETLVICVCEQILLEMKVNYAGFSVTFVIFIVRRMNGGLAVLHFFNCISVISVQEPKSAGYVLAY